MATKQFYAAGSFKYQNRMLTAGDGPFEMDGPTARLYAALGKITAQKPKVARAQTLPSEPAKVEAPVKAKRTPRKKAAAKKA